LIVDSTGALLTGRPRRRYSGRVLKKAILHRKNALFYKTDRGAHVGDLFMSLIHTCELCKADPFEYLTELDRHVKAVAAEPAAWMPWSYRQTTIDGTVDHTYDSTGQLTAANYDGLTPDESYPWPTMPTRPRGGCSVRNSTGEDYSPPEVRFVLLTKRRQAGTLSGVTYFDFVIRLRPCPSLPPGIPP
jgi:hypothetical protein